jgi:glycosyltransferase involved in cell wall biosynthesis
MRIAIIDNIGLTYDGNTLNNRGLGGSESAVILMSKELTKLNFQVTVFNNCEDSQAKPGIYDNVTYRPIHSINSNDIFEIMISSRTTIPFVPPEHYKLFQPDQYGRMHQPELFETMRKHARLKILWKHDTFCMGDEILEDLFINNHIHELFTLSDFHTTYVTNSNHGKRRIYEVLKNKVFQTRNGIVNYNPHVNTREKDPNLFVYNASISKGMIPLVTKIWPKVQEQLPHAKLTVIGGYYRFRENAQPDAQELQWHQLVKQHSNINFTGIISQKEIADILSKASYFIFPGAFPETFGISTLEAINYNVPIIGTRFGALEETALNLSSYLIDYAIEPNSIANFINADDQVNKFVKMTIDAYHNKYLHQQKMNYCNIVKDISTWDTVALQWKQHFYNKMKRHLNLDEYRKVKYINHKVHKVFGRKISNQEEWVEPKSPEQKISIITPFYNSEKFIEKTIQSIAAQDYDNYECILINDASTDNTLVTLHEVLETLPDSIRTKFRIINNTENKGAVYNQINAIRDLPDDNIIMLIDGDDWLNYDNSIFDFYNNVYKHDTEFTYGSCWSLVDSIPLVAQEYPPEIKQTKQYRSYRFNWGMPYTHLRTFRKYLTNDLPDNVFQDENGNWFKAGGDNATFYNIIEQADPTKVKCIQDIHYVYNDVNPLNDYKVNGEEQNKTARKITNMVEKKILIAIPTNKYIESDTFKSIYDLEIPDGYKVDFQYFHGYSIQQVRNLIADWVIRGYNYLFAVDSDMVFPRNTLKKMLSHDKDLVTGIYRQRKPEQILEIYLPNANGGMRNATMQELTQPLTEIVGCGFGCVLIKKKLFTTIPYPQFEYKMANANSILISEDNDFCVKARNHGFKLYCDTTIICEHIGSTKFIVNKEEQPEPNNNPIPVFSEKKVFV